MFYSALSRLFFLSSSCYINCYCRQFFRHGNGKKWIENSEGTGKSKRRSGRWRKVGTRRRRRKNEAAALNYFLEWRHKNFLVELQCKNIFSSMTIFYGYEPESKVLWWKSLWSCCRSATLLILAFFHLSGLKNPSSSSSSLSSHNCRFCLVLWHKNLFLTFLLLFFYTAVGNMIYIKICVRFGDKLVNLFRILTQPRKSFRVALPDILQKET